MTTTANTPSGNSLLGLHLFTETLHQLAPNLWRGEVTRAVKNPGKGDRHLVIIGPGRPGPPFSPWRVRGSMWQDQARLARWKIMIHSPTKTESYLAYHNATVFAPDYATGLHLLDILALNLVVTDF